MKNQYITQIDEVNYKKKGINGFYLVNMMLVKANENDINCFVHQSRNAGFA